MLLLSPGEVDCSIQTLIKAKIYQWAAVQMLGKLLHRRLLTGKKDKCNQQGFSFIRGFCKGSSQYLFMRLLLCT